MTAKQHQVHIARTGDNWTISPLEELTLAVIGQGAVSVLDGEGREYFRTVAQGELSFVVAGALGVHEVRLLNEKGDLVEKLFFKVEATSAIEDQGGKFKELLGIFKKTMYCYDPEGVGKREWRGKMYYNFIHWILDHVHTAKGMQYFSPHTGSFVEMLRQAQREDGLIWSNFFPTADSDYYLSAYGPYDYARMIDGVTFTRQPTENHCEANYVDALWLAWKGSGDDVWMNSCLDSAIRALDYSAHDRSRWSEKYQLLKRAYTIDSWDFQVKDKYLIPFPLGGEIMIDPDRTKFGIFFGDNTGYAWACDQLAEMLEAANRRKEAETFRQRATEIRNRLNQLTWNGKFFTHRIEEDPTVKRDLGVDEKAQIAMSNAYSINRNISHSQSTAILRTYQDLLRQSPKGSPGEWYAIYPPFEKGFDHHNRRWQYMNGGVHGHAAGELARGAFEHGFESYGADILLRLRELGLKHNGQIYFAYTGAEEPPPAPQSFTPMNLSAFTNMDLWDKGAPGVPGFFSGNSGNDLRNLPVGEQTFANVPYQITDPEKNGRRGAMAVANRSGYSPRVEIPVGAKAGAIYLLHTVDKVAPSQVAATLSFVYSDETCEDVCLLNKKHLSGWWFPLQAFSAQKEQDAGIAWTGPNLQSTCVGVYWVALPNPQPEKQIKRLVFTAAPDGATYALLSLTLADRKPYHAPNPISYGGPDNWAGGTCMYALMEGLAGVKDRATTFQQVRLSPRWSAADVHSVSVTARYAASKGYVAYQYRHDADKKRIEIKFTGSGEKCELRVLLPLAARQAIELQLNDKDVPFRTEKTEDSLYVVADLAMQGLMTIRLAYQ